MGIQHIVQEALMRVNEANSEGLKIQLQQYADNNGLSYSRTAGHNPMESWYDRTFKKLADTIIWLAARYGHKNFSRSVYGAGPGYMPGR